MILAVVKVRGHIDANPDVRKTLSLLGLKRANHCVIVPDRPEVAKMLMLCQRYITWGKISKETLAKLISKRGEKGSKKANKIYSKEEIEKMADEIVAGKKKVADYIDRVFRLNPPSGGYGNVKHIYPRGALGKRENLDKLIRDMA